MDWNMAGAAFDAEYERIAALYGHPTPSSSAQTPQASFIPVGDIYSGPRYAYDYLGSHWPGAATHPAMSQNAFEPVTNFQPAAKDNCPYPDPDPGYASSEPATSQASERLFTSPARAQDSFDSVGNFQHDFKPANDYQVAQPVGTPSPVRRQESFTSIGDLPYGYKPGNDYQVGQPTVARYQPDPSPIIGPSMDSKKPVAPVYLFPLLKEHLERVGELKDLVVAAAQTAKEHEARIKAATKEMWADNGNIRPRGLVGGTARKNRSIHGDYVKYEKTSAIGKQLLAHRIEVERKDLLGRNRQAGLKSMVELCSEVEESLMKQRGRCEILLGFSAAFNAGARDVKIVAKLAEIEDILFGEKNVKKMKDIEEMIQVIHSEYDVTL
ncbi:hypothetical protein H2200_000662 [Cladophialophora chaetospira]|uniref:Uncharacterized protein n=1 Tax=Cladophialophora chaetospira TaxID=386627 RepID=A0AA38XNZ3_9EURO|nr:hypothetical protein H2200_000662 [Cladophialophora chaetospira]